MHILRITVDRKRHFERILTKVKVSLCLIEHHVMKIQRVNIQPCTCLTLAVDGGEWAHLLCPQGKIPQSFIQEAEWATDPVRDL
jgi:hypothetical protein